MNEWLSNYYDDDNGEDRYADHDDDDHYDASSMIMTMIYDNEWLWKGPPPTPTCHYKQSICKGGGSTTRLFIFLLIFILSFDISAHLDKENVRII